MQIEPQAFDRVLSSMCTKPHPVAREAAERFRDESRRSWHVSHYLGPRGGSHRHAGEIAGLEEPAGYVASGGTEANIQAVRIARERAQTRRPTVVMPASAHFSFRKAADVLGVDLCVVLTDDSHRIDLEAVRSAVDADTAMVVAVAGTTEYGRVDPILELGRSPARSTPCYTSTPPGADSSSRLPTSSGTSATRRSTR